MAKNNESKEGLTAFEFNVNRVVVTAQTVPKYLVLAVLKDEFHGYYMDIAESFEDFEKFVKEVLTRLSGDPNKKHRYFDDEYFDTARREFDHFYKQRPSNFPQPESNATSQTTHSHQEPQMTNANNANTTQTNNAAETGKESKMKNAFMTAVYWIFMAIFVVVVLPVYAVGMLVFYFLKHVGMGAYFAVVETGKTVWEKARGIYAKASAWVKNFFSKKEEVKAAEAPTAEAPAAA